MAFLFAQAFHPAMRHAAGPRREVGVRTIFNLLGPLANPAGATRQVLGVFAEEWVSPLAETLLRLGSERALVVHGTDGLDEITLTGATHVAELRDGAIRRYLLTPQEMGLVTCEGEALRGGDASANAEIIRSILDGKATRAQTDVALLNAAAVIHVAGRASDLRQAMDAARAAVQSGAARAALDRLIAVSNGREQG
jgi:anthranilate phosphoribosyltransferase